MYVTSGHGIKVLDVIIEVGFILASVLGPEGDWRVLIIISKFWESLQLIRTWAIEQFSKAVQSLVNDDCMQLHY